MMSRSLFILSILIAILVVLISSHRWHGYGGYGGYSGYGRRWWGGRNRYRWNHYRPRYGRHHCVAKDIIPCAFLDSNQKILEQRQCPPSYTCTNGPLQVQINGTARYFRFCNVPFSPTSHTAEACKEEYIGRYHWPVYTKTCPGGVPCNGGPIYTDFYYRSVAYYFCGSVTPTRPNYEYALLKKACYHSTYLPLGLYPIGCGWWMPCGGEEIVISVAGTSITMKLCYGPKDAGFYYLNAFGQICKQHYNGTIYSDPGVVVTPNAGGTPTTVVTPKASDNPTTVDPNKDGNAAGENLPDQGLP